MSAIEIEMSPNEYEDFLNELYGDITICGIEMQQGTILREVDPVAFRCGLSDMPQQWKCSECGTIYDEEELAEECWEQCSDTVECSQCEKVILLEDAFHYPHTSEYFCCMSHLNKYQKNLDSHLGDV